jgi:hypothetical protein
MVAMGAHRKAQGKGIQGRDDEDCAQKCGSAKKKWDKQTEKAVEASASELWHIVDAILRTAYST